MDVYCYLFAEHEVRDMEYVLRHATHSSCTAATAAALYAAVYDTLRYEESSDQLHFNFEIP